MVSNQHYSFWLKLASTAAVIAALSMILVKASAWVNTGSASVLATLTDSIFDISASVINFFVVRYSITPADNEHRFGHGKAESLAGLIQGAFLIGSAILLIFHSVSLLGSTTDVKNVDSGITAVVISIVITLVLVLIQTIAVKQTNSVAIKADSIHYKGDLLMNIGVIIALVLTAKGFSSVDAWVAILIALYLIYGAFSVIVESVQSLMDRELSDKEKQSIKSIIESNKQVLGFHDLRTRRSGGTIFIQLHLELDDNLPLIQAHEISEQVEDKLMSTFPGADVLIHLDPKSVVVNQTEPIQFES